MQQKINEIAFKIITFAGEAKSEAMLAIYAAKDKNFEEADKKIKIANEQINLASKQHYELIQEEAQGKKVDISLIFMHAEDQLLATQTIILLAEEIIDLHKKISTMK